MPFSEYLSDRCQFLTNFERTSRFIRLVNLMEEWREIKYNFLNLALNLERTNDKSTPRTPCIVAYSVQYAVENLIMQCIKIGKRIG